MTNHKIIKIFLGLILILVNFGCVFKKTDIKLPKDLVFNDPIKEFKIKNASINDVFFKLYRDLPKILVEFYTEDEPYYKDYAHQILAKPINIDLKNTTVGEVVKEILKQDPRYTIKEIDGYFVIAQKNRINQNDYILNKRIKYKFMKNIMLIQLNSVIRGWFKQHGTDIFFKHQNMSWDTMTPMNIDLRNKTLREVLIDLGKFYKSSIFITVGKDEVPYLFSSDHYKKHRRHNGQ